MITEEDLEDVTVLMDPRYRGQFCGGKWMAFAREPRSIPEEAYGRWDDQQDFWPEYRSQMNDGYRKDPFFCVGVGETPQDAINDLVANCSRNAELPRRPIDPNAPKFQPVINPYFTSNPTDGWFLPKKQGPEKDAGE